MRVLGEYVLVEQTDTKKKSGIIMPGKAERSSSYITTFKVVGIGSGVPENYGIKEGDEPIFNQNVSFQGMKVTSDEKEKEVMTALTMIHYMDIIAIE